MCDSLNRQSYLSEPGGSIPITSLNPNLAVGDVEKLAPVQREIATGRRVSGKLAEKRAAQGPLKDGPLAVLEDAIDLSMTIGKRPKERREMIERSLTPIG